MRSAKYVITAIVLLTSLAWLAAEPNLLTTRGFALRSLLIQYSGIISIVLMSQCMLLALRLPLVERFTHGLDKSYRIHKWLGIAAVVSGALHWLLAIVPKKLVQAGFIDRPVRAGSGGANLDGTVAWLRSYKGEAEFIGEWGFYLMALLLVVSLVAIVRYKPFRISHRLMALCYIVLGVHSLVLIKPAYWGLPISILTSGFIVLGLAAALYSLFGRVGASKVHRGIIAKVRYFPGMASTEVVIDMPPSWPGFKPGQFAYLRYGEEEPHPFTIAGGKGKQLRFMIKALGDFTEGLHMKLREGELVEVEGPYGDFTFDAKSKQIWIAAGIGIAPFMARLEWLAAKPSTQPITLIFSAKHPDPSLISELQKRARTAGVALKLVDTATQPRMSAEQLARECGSVDDGAVYYCGPVGFAKQLKLSLVDSGLKPQHFHQELFEMR
ncbi:ferredoxin reductase family protein [Aliagarivorans taiwanensis]|uniref:ferredoxin reductase family protein n=1 Tax=Aliagarivorans taiwanensis TaxID=561966 RepID=UPI00040C1E29|nr:ferric reductase-like transmembrane domain-containing protein [Aliagarivorans taiwanensis]